MSRALLDPKRGLDERPVLDPMILNEKLEFLYKQMASILLQLSRLRFPRIGSLKEQQGNEESGSAVSRRPLIANMNDMVVHTSTPASVLPSQTYNSAEDWYKSLSDMHMAQLLFQHNDAVEDDEDARDKYVARQLFRNLAAQGRLALATQDQYEEFILFSEDLRPANVLLDKDLHVVGVIDWEFAIAAPARCSYDPPWWLLLQEPEYWPGGYREWMKAYEPRLQTFLSLLEAEEAKLPITCLTEEAENTSQTSPIHVTPLSQRMRESWDKETWMVNYAARRSWAFDFVWWKFLDERYYGPNESQDHHARLEMLSEPQRKAMESFVSRKMGESRVNRIVEYDDEEAAEQLAKVLL